MPGQPILTIDTLARERPFVIINHESYEMRLVDEYGLEDYARLQRWMREITELRAKSLEDMTEGEAKQLSMLLRDFVRNTFLKLPESVLVTLNDHHMLALAEGFGKAVGDLTATPTAKPSRQTGPTGSRRSKSSTVAVPSTG